MFVCVRVCESVFCLLAGIYCVCFRCSWFSLPINILTANSCSTFFFVPLRRVFWHSWYLCMCQCQINLQQFRMIFPSSSFICIRTEQSTTFLLGWCDAARNGSFFGCYYFVILRSTENNARAANFTWQGDRATGFLPAIFSPIFISLQMEFSYMNIILNNTSRVLTTIFIKCLVSNRFSSNFLHTMLFLTHFRIRTIHNIRFYSMCVVCIMVCCARYTDHILNFRLV